jgi:hypothetical protein
MLTVLSSNQRHISLLVGVLLISLFTKAQQLPVSKNEITPQNNAVTALNVKAWMRFPVYPGEPQQAFIVSGASIKNKAGKIISCRYVRTQRYETVNASTGVEVIFIPNEAITAADIAAVGLSGTGYIDGYKIEAISKTGNRPLYFKPNYSNPTLSVSLTSNISWLPSWAAASQFVDRVASFQCTIVQPVPAGSAVYAEMELTDGDVIRFCAYGPFAAGQVIKLDMPSPYRLSSSLISQIRILNGTLKYELRKLDQEKVTPPFLKTEFVNQGLLLKNVTIKYLEMPVNQPITLFNKSEIAIGPYTSAGDGIILNKKKLNADMTSSMILVQLVTGADDLRTNVKLLPLASELQGGLAFAGEVKDSQGRTFPYITGVLIAPEAYNCCPWDQVAALSHPSLWSGGGWSGYLDENGRQIQRRQIPYMRLYEVRPGDPRYSPFDPYKMASAVIPANNIRVAYLEHLQIYPKMGRGATFDENLRHNFGVTADQWDLKGIIISFWTDRGWRRAYSLFLGPDRRFVFGSGNGLNGTEAIIPLNQIQPYIIENTSIRVSPPR